MLVLLLGWMVAGECIVCWNPGTNPLHCKNSHDASFCDVCVVPMQRERCPVCRAAPDVRIVVGRPETMSEEPSCCWIYCLCYAVTVMAFLITLTLLTKRSDYMWQVFGGMLLFLIITVGGCRCRILCRPEQSLDL